MLYKESDFPVQAKPLHGFWLEDGVLRHRVYDRYQELKPDGKGPSGTLYRIYTYKDGTAIDRTSDRIGRFANGKYVGFSADPAAAVEAMKEYWRARAMKAEQEAGRASAMLRYLTVAELPVEDVPAGHEGKDGRKQK